MRPRKKSRNPKSKMDLEPSGYGYDLIEEKARREKILADRDQIELDIVKKNLVLRDDVHRAAFEAARKLRDSLHAHCKQTSPVLVGMDNPKKIEEYLRDEIDALLEEFIQNCV